MLYIKTLGGLAVHHAERSLGGAATQPRRLALVALLARAGARGISRDRILTLLWPDADLDRGRRALNQALYALRQDLGAEDLFLGTQELRLNPDLAESDAAAFKTALEGGQPERAAGIYTGPFLDGFHVAGATEFERWAEDERTALALEYRDLLGRLARAASGRGEHLAAAGWWRKLAGLDPIDSRVAICLMEALAAAGDVRGALQHARVYEALIEQELDIPADVEVAALAERLRRAGTVAPSSPPPLPASPPAAPLLVSPPPYAQPDAVSEPVPPLVTVRESRPTSGWAQLGGGSAAGAAPPRATWRNPWLAGLVVGALALFGWLARGMLHGGTARDPNNRIVVVGRITDYVGGSAGGLVRPLADMLATDLAQAPGLKVVSSARMFELIRQSGEPDDSGAGVFMAAARRAGATEMLEGALYQVRPGRLRLDLRRVELAGGGTLRAYSVEGSDLFSVADTATAHLARELGASGPSVSLAEATTRSVPAYRDYVEGLRLFWSGDRAAAERLFQSSLTEDSAFAMAQYYYALSTTGSPTEAVARLNRARALADRATDRERLFIRAGWAELNSSPDLRAIAETLTVRYPLELEGPLLLGRALIFQGDFLTARPYLQAVLDKDSIGIRAAGAVESAGRDTLYGAILGGRCAGCEAVEALVSGYLLADSSEAAERTARLWLRLQPNSPTAWRALGSVLSIRTRDDAAMAAFRTADSLDPSIKNAWIALADSKIRGGDFATADEILRTEMRVGPPDHLAEAVWNLAISLRYQGRMIEALAAARQYRRVIGTKGGPAGSAPVDAVMEAQVLLESGATRASAALFDSIANFRVAGESNSAAARNQAWNLTHAADAVAASGDTARLVRLVDSIRVLGERSGYGRDQRLHFHVEGLLAEARGNDEAAVTAFRQAIYSPTLGYTRTNFELGRILLRLGRPAEAVAMLQAALRGALDASNTYLSRTELHEMLGTAWAKAGRRDSAIVELQRAGAAWAHADASQAPRLSRIRQALSALGATP